MLSVLGTSVIQVKQILRQAQNDIIIGLFGQPQRGILIFAS